MAKVVRAIFNLDTNLYPETVSGRNKTGDSLENGAFVSIGQIEDNYGGREIRAIGLLTGDAVEKVGFVSHNNLMYDVREDERDYFCAPEELIRTYYSNKSTVGTHAKKMFDGADALVVGDKLTPKVGTFQLKKATADERVVAVVEALETFNGQPSIVISWLV